MRISILASSVLFSSVLLADDYSVVLSNVEVSGISEQNNLKGYVAYESSDIARNGLTNQETPQTIQVVDIQKNKNYGTNEL